MVFIVSNFEKLKTHEARMKLLVFGLDYHDSVGAPNIYFIIHTTKNIIDIDF